MRRTRVSVICFLIFSSCSPSSAPSPTLATVNGEKVSLAEFQKYLAMEQWKFPSLKSSKKKMLDQFLNEELLVREAKRRGLNVSEKEIEETLQSFKKNYGKEEDFEKLLQARGTTLKDFMEAWGKEVLIRKLSEAVGASAPPVEEKELRAYYRTRLDSFRHAEQVHARQIVTDSKEKATALRGMLEKGTSFEEAASKYSLSPDRKKGGDLGWFERGVMPKEFDDVCFSLPAGETSEVVATSYGFHIFQVLEKRPGGVEPFEEVQETIRKKIAAEKGSEVFQKWYEAFRKEAKIEVDEEVFQKIQ